MLLAANYPVWVHNSFPIIQIVLVCILVALSLALVICILFQSSSSDGGIGALGGQTTETFYSKNKGKSLQGLMRKLTIIFAIAILVVSIVYLALVAYYPVNIVRPEA